MIAALCMTFGILCPQPSSQSLGVIPDYSLNHEGYALHCIRQLGGESIVLLDKADFVTFTIARDRLVSEGVSVDELYFGCEGEG